MTPLAKADEAARRSAAAACADFLKSLGRAVQLVALYGPAHLVASAALRECWLTASAMLEAAGPAALTLTLAEGRWAAGGAFVADDAQSPDAVSYTHLTLPTKA